MVKTSLNRGSANRIPYPGLEPFQEEDAEFYCGRQDEVAALMETLNKARRVVGSRAVVVAGSSGVGKSSLIRAGVLPNLRADPENWVAIGPFRPGREPLVSMENRLEQRIRSMRLLKYRPRTFSKTWLPSCGFGG